MVHQYVMEHYYDHTFMILFVINFILAIIAYKLGFAKKLPLVKSIFVYVLLVIGVFILSILFNVIPSVLGSEPLPMTESLVIICLVLGIYRFRLHRERKAKKVE